MNCTGNRAYGKGNDMKCVTVKCTNCGTKRKVLAGEKLQPICYKRGMPMIAMEAEIKSVPVISKGFSWDLPEDGGK